ncbi:MAG: Crp/Fnr family transcriptional regulator [Muribaculaceae bacterium]|nr:Crp/Fnr family transcriptional regulator [Muribaculaceae bacterium]
MDSVYNILMSLPLLNGVSRARIMEVAGKTKFHFLKYLKGETVVRAGDECDHLKFILSGSVRASISNPDNRFKVSQTLRTPLAITPEFLYGAMTKFPCDVLALEPTGIMQIAKADYLRLLSQDSVFLINYVNLVSSISQRATYGMIPLASGNLDERIAYWIVALTQRGGTDIVLECKQRDLYSLFGVQRSSFIATLDSMKQRGLIDYDSNAIIVNSRKDLLEMLNSHIKPE